MKPSYKKYLEIARKAVLVGLQSAVAGSAKSVSAIGHNVTTQADLDGNESVISYLCNCCPRILVLSEETKKDPKLSRAKKFWVLDPIDGSNNRSKSFPYWSVSLSLVVNGEVVVAVVGTMLYGGVPVLFHAVKNEGMFMDGIRVHVSDKKDFIGATLAFDNSYTWTETLQVLLRLSTLYPMPWFKNFGSAVLTICEVAAGIWDGHYHWAFKPWDIAAGLLMIPEAGGVIIDLETLKPATLATTKAVCGNKKIVNLILSQVAPV
jgi:myo-inositol-1(or 4)-monophosphatase